MGPCSLAHPSGPGPEGVMTKGSPLPGRKDNHGMRWAGLGLGEVVEELAVGGGSCRGEGDVDGHPPGGSTPQHQPEGSGSSLV